MRTEKPKRAARKPAKKAKTPKKAAPVVHPTTLKLPGDLKERIAKLAEASEKTPHAFLLETVKREVEKAELRRDFYEAGRQSWEEFKRTGTYYEFDDVADYLRRRARGERVSRPKAKTWRG